MGYLITPDERKWLDLHGRMDPQTRDRAIALITLEAALIKNVEGGTTRFKPRDLKNTQEILGEALFKWAWKHYLALGIIVSDRESTAGRYFYNPLE